MKQVKSSCSKNTLSNQAFDPNGLKGKPATSI